MKHRGLDSHLRIVLSIFLLSGALGCATTKVYRHDDVFESELPSKARGTLTVGVLPFTHDAEEKAETRAAVERFEGHYFAARLTKYLREAGWFRGAFCVPSATPGVDLLVSGHINRSDGEVTDLLLSVARPDLLLGELEVGINLDSDDFEEGEPPPERKMWVTAVNQIAELIEESEAVEVGTLDRVRVAAYRGLPSVASASGGSRPSAAALGLVEKAVEIERDKVLAPISTVMIEQSDAVLPAYVGWQQNSTEMLEAKRRKSNMALAMGAMAVVSAGAGLYAASSGVPASSLGSLNMQTALMGLLAAESASQSSELGRSVEGLRTSFSQEMHPLTIKLGGAVYEIVGTTEQQLAQIREIVRRHLAEEGA
jgi:hypothetical protein